MKTFWWILLGGAGAAGAGYLLNQAVIRAEVKRQVRAAAVAAGLKSGTVVATPAGVGVVP